MFDDTRGAHHLLVQKFSKFDSNSPISIHGIIDVKKRPMIAMTLWQFNIAMENYHFQWINPL